MAWWHLPVPPLGLPPQQADAAAVAGSEAGKLFLDRAHAVLPVVQIDQANAGAVASLCRRLDGMPLAIELAAARAGLLTPGRSTSGSTTGFACSVARPGPFPATAPFVR